jgi:hypothetical protein
MSNLLKQYKNSLSKASKKYTIGYLDTQHSKTFKHSNSNDLFAPDNTYTLNETRGIHQALSNLYRLFAVYENVKNKGDYS